VFEQSLSEKRSAIKLAMEELKAEWDLLNTERLRIQEGRDTLKAEREQLEKEKREFATEKGKLLSHGCGTGDLIGLNFGGEAVVTVKRSLLQQVDGSMLERIFSGRYEDLLDRDSDGNVFWDYPPGIMLPLINMLRLRRDMCGKGFLPLPDVPVDLRMSWNLMVQFFGLESLHVFEPREGKSTANTRHSSPGRVIGNKFSGEATKASAYLDEENGCVMKRGDKSKHATKAEYLKATRSSSPRHAGGASLDHKVPCSPGRSPSPRATASPQRTSPRVGAAAVTNSWTDTWDGSRPIVGSVAWAPLQRKICVNPPQAGTTSSLITRAITNT